MQNQRPIPFDPEEENRLRSQIEQAFETLPAGSPAVPAPVTSVFGRIGVVVATAHNYAFNMLSSIPTTIAG
jgi:hypothetical protein